MEVNDKKADNIILEKKDRIKNINYALHAESEQIKNINELSDVFVSIYKDLHKLEELLSSSISGPQVNSLLKDFDTYNKTFKNRTATLVDNERKKVNDRIERLNNVKINIEKNQKNLNK